MTLRGQTDMLRLVFDPAAVRHGIVKIKVKLLTAPPAVFGSKPQRGGLFIEGPNQTLFSFCFSAARRVNNLIPGLKTPADLCAGAIFLKPRRRKTKRMIWKRPFL